MNKYYVTMYTLDAVIVFAETEEEAIKKAVKRLNEILRPRIGITDEDLAHVERID